MKTLKDFINEEFDGKHFKNTQAATFLINPSNINDFNDYESLKEIKGVTKDDLVKVYKDNAIQDLYIKLKKPSIDYKDLKQVTWIYSNKNDNKLIINSSLVQNGIKDKKYKQMIIMIFVICLYSITKDNSFFIRQNNEKDEEYTKKLNNNMKILSDFLLKGYKSDFKDEKQVAAIYDLIK